MKVFQIISGFCFWNATSQFPTINDTQGCFPPECIFVEAPDYVFEGWGYNPDEVGDARFIKPTPPEGWLYDDETGTFYPKDKIAPSKRPSYGDFASMYTAIENGMKN